MSYVSFVKYVSSVPGVYYAGFQGIEDLVYKGNRDNGVAIIPDQYYDETVYRSMLNGMLDFRSKPQGIKLYHSKSNGVDTTYTLTVFERIEDFLAIAQSPWFETYSQTRMEFLDFIQVKTLQKNLEYDLPITTETTFEELDEIWNNTEVIIA